MNEPYERRACLRLPVRWPVRIASSNGKDITLDAVTENLSSQGFYCWVRRAFKPGDTLHCVIEFPHRVSIWARKLRMRCEAEVVRSECGSETGLYGVACHIRDYSIEVVD